MRIAEGQTVEGAVIKVVPGGVIVDIGRHCYMPRTYLELNVFRGDLHDYIGQTLTAQVTEVDETRDLVVLSRRAWLFESQKEERDAFLASLTPGHKCTGVVVSVVNFGAFVAIGPMAQGLIHKSQLPCATTDHPTSVISVDDEVEVQVTEVSLGPRPLISLSLLVRHGHEETTS